MAYVVVGYPRLSQADFDWVQRYREKNDRYFSIVKPHYTFVFAVDGMSQADFAAEIRKQSAGFEKFAFELKVAIVTLDKFQGIYHELLVPEKGYSNIVKFHDRLYADKLLGERRFDLGFTPHVGIGNSNDLHECRMRVDTLNAEELSIKGTLETLDIVEYLRGTGQPVRTVERIPLA